MREFEVTEDHLKLIKRFYIGWEDSCYDGAPCVGIKRPYGNSDRVGDIIEILGWECDMSGEYGWPDELYDKALKIHRETEVALQILTENLTIQPGVYENNCTYSSKGWKIRETE